MSTMSDAEVVSRHSGVGTLNIVPHSVSVMVWYLLGRAFIVTLFLGGPVLVSQVYSGEILHPPDLRLVVLLSLTFLQICFSLLWLLRSQSYAQFFIQLQLGWDLLLSFFTVYITGGISSLFTFLFIFVIIGCALISTRKDLYTTVVAAMLLYSGLVGLQHYAYLPAESVAESLSDNEIIYRLFLNLVTFLLAGILGYILSVRLRRSEQLLQRKRHDYAELEQLNALILQSIPSGVIVVDESGKIRAVNAAAAAICGMPTALVLQKQLTDIFPAFSVNEITPPVERGEFNSVNPQGEQRIIGYNATRIQDPADRPRILITFQDLTEARRAEQRLQLGERLAAIGKLAAGLAHEIRNPLASLGGSIQLLAEQIDLDKTEKNLFAIMQRETARLNRLVSDFLIFAKPGLPVLGEHDLVELIAEMVTLAKADPLFADIRIATDLPPEYIVRMDSAQMHQALWNLLVNAAQFAQAPGRIMVGINAEEGWIWVDDNGLGLGAEEKKQIFEPFYTTRASGTGLGLSIVHAIVTAHGWKIDCDKNGWGGARMQISLV